MKGLKEYIQDINEQSLNENVEMVASIIAASSAFDGYSGSSDDEPGLIRSIIDSIKDKRKKKIIANAFAKLENDKDIDNLLDELDKKYIEKIKNNLKNVDNAEERIKRIIDHRDLYDITDEVFQKDSYKELVALIKSKLDKKEIKYIDEIIKEIQSSKNKKFKKSN